MTAQRPAPDFAADIELRQLATLVQICAVKVKAGATQILTDLAHGRLVPSASRKLNAEVFELGEAQAALKQAQKAAARQRGEMAA